MINLAIALNFLKIENTHDLIKFPCRITIPNITKCNQNLIQIINRCLFQTLTENNAVTCDCYCNSSRSLTGSAVNVLLAIVAGNAACIAMLH